MKKAFLSNLLFATLTFTVLVPVLEAQERNNADWVTPFSQSVGWQRITSFGILIVSTGEGLHGVDPETGKILWSRKELANLPESGYQPVDESPFVQVTMGGASPVVYVLEPFDGTVVFNSKDAGIQEVKKSYVLPTNLSLLLQGIAPGKKSPSLFMIDLASGKKLWEKHDEFGMITAFRELGGDEFLLSTLWNMYKINSKTGTIHWTQPLDPASAAQLEKMKGLGSMLKNLAESSVKPGDVEADFYPLGGGKNFIIGYQSKSTSESKDASGKTTTTVSFKSGYQCISLADGKPVWKEGVQFDGKKGKIIFDGQGLIVCPNAGQNTMINMVDYNTGAKKWGKNLKGIKVKGGVVDYVYTKAGILLILATSSSDNDPNYMMNMLDASTGTLRFENYAKVRGTLQRTELLDGGLFFATDEEADILNLANGETLFDKSIRTGSNMNVSGEGKIYVYSTKDRMVYEIDKKTKTKNVFSKTEIRFEGKEVPTELEIRAGGVLVMGMQNIVQLGADGAVKFQKYFAAPDISGIMKALNAAMAVRAAYIGLAAGVTSAAVAATTAKYADHPVEKEVGAKVAEAYGGLSAAGFSYAGKYMQAISKRFKATANSPDFMFMMTEGEGRKDNRLIRVSKTNGEVMDYVSLGKDKSPSYEVDNISYQIYYRKDPNKISCFKFAGK
jgi:outer membrane protein assembly factor BamB